MSGLRARLVRLEQKQFEQQGKRVVAWNDIDWNALCFAPGTEEEQEARGLEFDPFGCEYREQLRRLGLPQPDSLAGIDLVAECVRLADIPGRPKGLSEANNQLP